MKKENSDNTQKQKFNYITAIITGIMGMLLFNITWGVIYFFLFGYLDKE